MSGIAIVMYCVVLLLEWFCGRKTTLEVKYFKLHYSFQRAWIEFRIHIMSGWFKQQTLCCSIENKMSEGVWMQFVKAAFQRTCLSGWVNDPLHHNTPNHRTSLSVLFSFITLWNSLRTFTHVDIEEEKNLLISTLSEKAWFKIQNPCSWRMHVTQRDNTNSTFISISINITVFWWSELCSLLLQDETYNGAFNGSSIRVWSVEWAWQSRGWEKREERGNTMGLAFLSVGSGPYLLSTH